MKQHQHSLNISATGRGFYNITREVQAWVRETGMQTGMLNLFVQHTSCSLMVQENADPDVLRDMEMFMSRLVVDGDAEFLHRDEGDDVRALCDKLEQEQEGHQATHQTLVKTLLNGLIESVKTSANNQQATADYFNQLIAEHFDTLFTTEDSIDQLKQTILQLAVMGKLVPQNPSDEPASVLLGKIATEKARLIKAGEIKKQKPLPKITEAEKPFDLPDGWEWVSLSHLGLFSGGKTPSKAKSIYWNGNIPWVTPKDMKVKYITESQDHVTKQAIDDGLALYSKEAVLFVVRSGILRHSFPVAVTKIPCTVNQDLKVLSLFDTELSSYVQLMMKGFEQYILKNLTKSGMTIESIVFDKFSIHYFIIPPVAEQQRIVKKVDELMSLCDKLKTNLTQAQLAETIVKQAVS